MTPPTPRLTSARSAKTLKDVGALERDNVSTGEHWIITDGEVVTLVAQRRGKPPTQWVDLPRATFEAFIDWYNTGKFLHPQE